MKYIKLTILLAIIIIPQLIIAAECEILQQKIIVNELPIVYSRVGENNRAELKPTILLLHGLFASKSQWDQIICQLANDKYTIIAPDLPGYGKSQGYAITDYQLERQAAILRQFIDELNIANIHIAGGSMGGAIAALFAENNSDLTLTLAFLGAPLGIVSYNDPLKQIITQGINPLIPINSQEFDIEMGLLFNYPPQIPREVIANKVANYVENNKHYVQVWNIVNLYMDILQNEFTFNKPVFIAWGQADKIFKDEGKTKLADTFINSSAVTIEHAGHLPASDNPDELVKQYLQFLAYLP